MNYWLAVVPVTTKYVFRIDAQMNFSTQSQKDARNARDGHTDTAANSTGPDSF